MRCFVRIIRLALVVAVTTGVVTVAATTGADAATPRVVATHGVRIVEVYFDSLGPDNRSNTSLNREWVKIRNMTDRRKLLTGWTLHDASSHRYTFPAMVLAPHAAVRVHTGHGFHNTYNRYWSSPTYIWNNSGDTARLANANGIVKSECAYNSRNDSRKFC